MKTSYFFSLKLQKNHDLVSIAVTTPNETKTRFPKIRQYDDLKPPKKLVEDYKTKKITREEYSKQYNEQLNKLDAKTIYLDLKDSIILCWETPGKFCHRHLVSKYLNSCLGLNIKEL